MVWCLAIGEAKLREIAEVKRSWQKDGQKPVLEDVMYKCSRFNNNVWLHSYTAGAAAIVN